MSIFSTPASVPVKQVAAEGLDPASNANREAIKAENAAAAAKTGDDARRRFASRTMGVEGANALFTGGAQGYRTMGSANV